MPYLLLAGAALLRKTDLFEVLAMRSSGAPGPLWQLHQTRRRSDHIKNSAHHMIPAKISFYRYLSPLIHDEAAELLSDRLQNAQVRCGVASPGDKHPDKTAKAARVLAYLWGHAAYQGGNYVARPMQEEGGTYASRRSAGNQQLRAEYLNEFNQHMEGHLLKCLPDEEQRLYQRTLAQCIEDGLSVAGKESRMQEVLNGIIARAEHACT